MKECIKGKELNINELKDNQLVYIEFDFYDVTMCGETDEEYDLKIQSMEEEYPDGVYMVDLNSKFFIKVGTDEGIHFYHNLIGKIYEYNVKND